VCTSPIPKVLQQLDSVTLPPSRCEVSQFEFCTAAVQTASGMQGQCPGDSGGPLLAQSPTGGRVVVGVASRGGRTCGDAVSAYTSVAGFRDWIKSVITR
jgi:secreted trypsin-like serine protease